MMQQRSLLRQFRSSFHLIVPGARLYAINGLHSERVVLVELNANQVGTIQKSTNVFLRILYKYTGGLAKADPLIGREVLGVLIPEGLYRALEPLAQKADQLPTIYIDETRTLVDKIETDKTRRALFDKGFPLVVKTYAYKESLKDESTSAAAAGDEKKVEGPASSEAKAS